MKRIERMSMVLFVIGGIAVMVGAAAVAYGIPINEFSFGNTLIVSGTTIGAGGLIVIAIAAAVAQLRRMVEALTEHAPMTTARPAEAAEPPPETHGIPAPGRIPFPPKARPAEPRVREPQAFEPPVAPPVPAGVDEVHPGQSFAPVLRNPEAPPVTVEEEVSLSPPVGFGEAARPAPPPASEPLAEAPWRVPPPSSPPRETPTTNFDAMWPATKPARPPAAMEPEPEPKLEPPPHPPAAESRASSPPRAVAILKSGVVDGMGYTLYVDGSIEAELPQGTLRFASIDELRAHLEKNS
jgi:hypothetical protein